MTFSVDSILQKALRALIVTAMFFSTIALQIVSAEERKQTKAPAKMTLLQKDPALKKIMDKLDERDYPESLNLCNKYISEKPSSPLGYFYRGQIYHLMGQDSRALIDYGTAIKLDPDFGPAYMMRGFLYREMKQYEKSKQDFLKVNKYVPDSSKISSARLDEMYRRYDLSDAKFRKQMPNVQLCQEADQANRAGDIKLALSLYNKGIPNIDAELAKDNDKEFARLFKGNTYYNRAYCYLNLGYYKEALSDLNKSIEYNPNFIESRKNRAKLYELLKRPDLAKLDYKKIVELEADQKNIMEVDLLKNRKKTGT